MFLEKNLKLIYQRPTKLKRKKNKFLTLKNIIFLIMLFKNLLNLFPFFVFSHALSLTVTLHKLKNSKFFFLGWWNRSVREKRRDILFRYWYWWCLYRRNSLIKKRGLKSGDILQSPAARFGFDRKFKNHLQFKWIYWSTIFSDNWR